MSKIARDKLLEVLKSKLIKDGRMTVPRHSGGLEIQEYVKSAEFQFKDLKARLMRDEEKDMIRQFMLDNFYNSAPVPKALRLRQTLDKFPYLNDELDLMMNSGVCQLTLEAKTDKFAGATINTAWKVDYDYDSFPVDPVDWLNTAAEIAHKQNDPDYARVVWRDYQIQLVYHLIQGVAQKRKCKYIMYGGMGFSHPQYRDRGIIPVMLDVSNQKLVPNGCLFTFMGTFPGFYRVMTKALPSTFQLLADIPYSELCLRHNEDGTRVFEGIPDGLILMGSA